MRDYKELIEALRSFANSYVQMFGKDKSSQLMSDASDARKNLSRKMRIFMLILATARLRRILCRIAENVTGWNMENETGGGERWIS